MKKLIISIAFCLISINSFGFEIYASGASMTNCKNVDTPRKFTSQLENLLRAKGVNAVVVNGGVDGDKIPFIYRRMTEAINSDTRIVIYSSGGNISNESIKIEYVEKVLSFLKEKNIASILAVTAEEESMSPEYNKENADLAKKYGAYYYGSISKNIPMTNEYWRGDRGAGAHGHMTAEGCELWAKNMLPLVLQVIKDKNIQ